MKMLLLIAIVLLCMGNYASACPFCDQQSGRAVNAGIFDDDFAANLVISMLPFLLLGLAVAIFSSGESKDAGP